MLFYILRKRRTEECREADCSSHNIVERVQKYVEFLHEILQRVLKESSKQQALRRGCDNVPNS
jgi:hypothetical protein